MRTVIPRSLWIGNVRDGRDISALRAEGIQAVLNLADNELPALLPREIVSARFPVSDGAENPRWILRGAIAIAADWIREGVPALVCCSAGISRSPAIVAAAMARSTGSSAADCLTTLSRTGPVDVSPGLWRDIVQLLDRWNDDSATAGEQIL